MCSWMWEVCMFTSVCPYKPPKCFQNGYLDYGIDCLWTMGCDLMVCKFWVRFLSWHQMFSLKSCTFKLSNHLFVVCFQMKKANDPTAEQAKRILGTWSSTKEQDLSKIVGVEAQPATPITTMPPRGGLFPDLIKKNGVVRTPDRTTKDRPRNEVSSDGRGDGSWRPVKNEPPDPGPPPQTHTQARAKTATTPGSSSRSNRSAPASSSSSSSSSKSHPPPQSSSKPRSSHYEDAPGSNHSTPSSLSSHRYRPEHGSTASSSSSSHNKRNRSRSGSRSRSSGQSRHEDSGLGSSQSQSSQSQSSQSQSSQSQSSQSSQLNISSHLSKSSTPSSNIQSSFRWTLDVG